MKVSEIVRGNYFDVRKKGREEGEGPIGHFVCIEKAKENNVPKNLWNILQKGEKIEVDGKAYIPNMVLGENRKGIKEIRIK